jgi:hypothetical protein
MPPSDLNPYEPPHSASAIESTATDNDSDVAALRRRIETLEQRLDGNRLTSPSHWKRIFAIWGYIFLGWVLVWSIAWTVIFLANVVMRLSREGGPVL